MLRTTLLQQYGAGAARGTPPPLLLSYNAAKTSTAREVLSYCNNFHFVVCTWRHLPSRQQSSRVMIDSILHEPPPLSRGAFPYLNTKSIQNSTIGVGVGVAAVLAVGGYRIKSLYSTKTLHSKGARAESKLSLCTIYHMQN